MKAITIQDITRIVSDAYGVTHAELCSRKAARRFWYARQVAMYLARELTVATGKEIAGHFQKTDSCVGPAHVAISALVDKNDGKAALINALRTKLIEDAYGRAA